MAALSLSGVLFAPLNLFILSLFKRIAETLDVLGIDRLNQIHQLRRVECAVIDRRSRTIRSRKRWKSRQSRFKETPCGLEILEAANMFCEVAPIVIKHEVGLRLKHKIKLPDIAAWQPFGCEALECLELSALVSFRPPDGPRIRPEARPLLHETIG